MQYTNINLLKELFEDEYYSRSIFYIKTWELHNEFLHEYSPEKKGEISFFEQEYYLMNIPIERL